MRNCSSFLISSSLVNSRSKIPFTAREITPVSSLTIRTTASLCSLIPSPALCRVPRLISTLGFDVSGKIHPADRLEFVGNALFIPYFLIGVGMIIDVRSLFTGGEALKVAAMAK